MRKSTKNFTKRTTGTHQELGSDHNQTVTDLFMGKLLVLETEDEAAVESPSSLEFSSDKNEPVEVQSETGTLQEITFFTFEQVI